MAKDLYEENKELKRVLYNIEKAILDFRLTQLDLPLEKVNIPSLGIPQPQAQPTSYTLNTCSCDNGEGCSCDCDCGSISKSDAGFGSGDGNIYDVGQEGDGR